MSMNSKYTKTQLKKTVSHTKLTTLNTCPFKYYLKYEQKIVPKAEKGGGLRRGTAFSNYLETQNIETIQEFYNELTKKAVTVQQRNDYRYENEIIQYLAKRHTQAFTDEQREIEFLHEIGNTGYKSHGFIDGISITGDTITLKEDKMMSRWGNSDRKMLIMNGQVIRYFLAAEHLYPNHNVQLQYRVTRFPNYKQKVEETIEQYIAVSLQKLSKIKDENLFAVDMITSDMVHAQKDFYIESFDSYIRELKWRKRTKLFPQVFNNTCKEYGGCEYAPACTKQPGYQTLYTNKKETK